MRGIKGEGGRGLTHRSYTNTDFNSGSADQAEKKERDRRRQTERAESSLAPFCED